MAVIFRPKARVAVVELHGVIGGSLRIPGVVQLLERARTSRSSRAVALDIDSPGGSASGSEYLNRAAAKIDAGKPVVAFLRGMGASGGYMAACAARHIVALPSALVGSVGVISVRPIVQELLGRVGVSVSVHKSGELKDMGAVYRTPTEEEGQKLQGLVDELYQAFVELVAQSRNLDAATVQRLATGEVFTGRKALELGLVDELGDLDTAVDAASRLAGIRRRPPLVLAQRRGLVQRLTGRWAAEAMDAALAELEMRLLPGLEYR